MSIILKKKNFAKSTLNSGIAAGATALTVATGEGTKFPSSGKFRAVLWGASYANPSDDPNVEVVEAELNAGDVFDITRAKEDTSAQAWSAPDNFVHTITAETIEEVGQVIQTVHVADGAVATGSTTIPADDTIPQNTEGDQYLSAAITPTDASNKLLIEIVLFLSHSAQGLKIVALFQDSAADALAAGAVKASANARALVVITHEMTAGTTSETTFKVRAGSEQAGTMTLNGSGGSRYFGGVMASHIRITEYKA